MAINPEIALGIRRQPLESPINKMAQVLQLQGMRDEAALRQAGMQRQNKLLELMGGTYEKPEMREEALLQGGFVKEANDLTKNRVDALKVQADTDKNRIDAAHKRVDSWGQAMGFVRQNPTVENAQAAVQHLVTMGVMPQEMAQSAVASLQADPSPQGVARFADMGFRAALAAKDQLPKIEVRNIGGQTITQSVDAVSGTPTITGAVQNTQSPDAVLQAQTSTANNQRSVGAQMANAAATRAVADATRDAASIKDKRDVEMKLADDYRAQSKPFKEVSDAYKQITATLDKASTSPAATLAAATKFMKLLDPGSVVRESELGMALAASGVIDRMTNYHNTLLRGKVLTPAQAQDFRNITQQIYQAAQQQQVQIDTNYQRQAQQYGLRPDMIVQDLGQSKPAPSGPVDLGSLPSGGGKQPRVVDFGSLR
jgi:hypothetical protein